MPKEEQAQFAFMSSGSSALTVEERVQDFILHPTSTQDVTCPYIEWMGEDLVHCPGVGEWKCRNQKIQTGECGEGIDYELCSNQNKLTCPVYLESRMAV